MYGKPRRRIRSPSPLIPTTLSIKEVRREGVRPLRGETCTADSLVSAPHPAPSLLPLMPRALINPRCRKKEGREGKETERGEQCKRKWRREHQHIAFVSLSGCRLIDNAWNMKCYAVDSARINILTHTSL